MNGPGALGVAPEDGRVLWQHELPTGGRIVQPAVTADGDLLLSVGEGSDLYRVRVAQKDGGWAVEERWTSEGLKPYFSDFVVHEGHAYGIDDGKVACINVEDGKNKWEGGDYGSGQLVLLPEQDVLLVVSEQTEYLHHHNLTRDCLAPGRAGIKLVLFVVPEFSSGASRL
jgi:outer membrane protein assembly factor BamB